MEFKSQSSTYGQVFENGCYRPVSKKELEGAFWLSALLALICTGVIWLVWRVIKYFLNLIFNNKKNK